MKIIIAPDSFKGTINSRQVAEIISNAAFEVLDNPTVITVPVADGGEGTIDAFNAEIVCNEVTGPDWDMVPSYYGRSSDTAIVEIAVSSGLTLTNLLDPSKTTSYGAGELIMKALDDGYRKFIIGLGGSATNDCGCGLAAACGVKFIDADGNSFIPVGGTLDKVESIDLSSLDPRIKQSQIVGICDVDNPLYGPDGAAYVFAPQKGADADMVKMLDEGLRHISGVIEASLGCDISGIKGAGAAGGIGASVVALLGGTLKKGIDVVLGFNNFEEVIKDADLIVTGEGRIDFQTHRGKVVKGISERAKKYDIPVIAFCGSSDIQMDNTDLNITGIFPILRKILTREEAFSQTESQLYETSYNVFRIIKAFGKQ